MSRDSTYDDTAEYPAAPVPADAPWPRVEVDLAAASHPGRVRANNEDHYLVLRFGRSMEVLLTNLPAGRLPSRTEEAGYGLVVADGVGGAGGGEVASELAVTTLVRLALETPDWVFGTGPEETERRMQRMADRWCRIQEAVRERGRSDPTLGQMGTTMSVAVSLSTRLLIGHVGDSRVYLFRHGQLHQLTRDHTLVQSMMDLGLLTPEQAATHPQRHVLVRSFHAAADIVCKGDFQQATLADGDQLLLCTDGLTDMVDAAAVGSVLSRPASADEACQALVAAALENGGKDNVTVALARYRVLK